jgi:hypothetical protein
VNPTRFPREPGNSGKTRPILPVQPVLGGRIRSTQRSGLSRLPAGCPSGPFRYRRGPSNAGLRWRKLSSAARAKRRFAAATGTNGRDEGSRGRLRRAAGFIPVENAQTRRGFPRSSCVPWSRLCVAMRETSIVSDSGEPDVAHMATQSRGHGTRHNGISSLRVSGGNKPRRSSKQ